MQLHCKAIEVANVEWAEVGMEAVVEKGVIDGEVYGGVGFESYWSRATVGL